MITREEEILLGSKHKGNPSFSLKRSESPQGNLKEKCCLVSSAGQRVKKILPTRKKLNVQDPGLNDSNVYLHRISSDVYFFTDNSYKILVERGTSMKSSNLLEGAVS